MQHGLVFNIQKYSLHDGPGIRATVFLKGCPLRCPWCHNPEGISPRPEVVVVEGRCLGCGQCRRACPFGASLPGDGPMPSRHESCMLCGACVDACPAAARQWAGRQMTVSQVLETVWQDRIFYDESGGGVTFSGGEPLAQIDFLRACLEACRARGLRTAVDTCGLAPAAHLRAIAPLTDLFLYDLKLMDPARHEHYTGASNDVILDNLRALGRVHRQIWVRVPIIPGVNDDAPGLQAIARFAAAIPGVRQVNLLPFHRTGLPKLARLGRTAPPLAGIQPPSPEVMAAALAVFQHVGLETRAGG
jgi:pyruvate formate lyase activating enzyme